MYLALRFICGHIIKLCVINIIINATFFRYLTAPYLHSEISCSFRDVSWSSWESVLYWNVGTATILRSACETRIQAGKYIKMDILEVGMGKRTGWSSSGWAPVVGFSDRRCKTWNFIAASVLNTEYTCDINFVMQICTLFLLSEKHHVLHYLHILPSTR